MLMRSEWLRRWLRRMAAAVMAAMLAGPAEAIPEIALAPGQDRLLVGALAETGREAGGTCDRAHAPFVPFDGTELAVPHAAPSPEAVWLRFRLRNPEPRSAALVLSLPYPPLDEIALHVTARDGTATTSRHGKAGRPEGKILPGHSPAFLVPLDPGEDALVELCLRSSGYIAAPLWLMREGAFLRTALIETLALGLMLGVIGTTFAFASALAATLRRTEFVALMAYTAAAILYVLAASGLGKAWLWPEWTVGADAALRVSGLLTLASAIWLLRPLLKARERDRRSDDALRGFVVVALVGTLSPWMPAGMALAVQVLAGGMGPVVVLAALVRLWWLGAPHAPIILVGWGLGLLAGLYLYLRILGIAPYHPVEPLLGPLMCTLAALCFAHVLAEILRATEWKSATDPLTGLWNRRWLTACARREIARCQRTGAVISAGVFDADFFKHVNDRWGHAVGDAVLREIAALARAHVRPEDHLARIGGEEFCILFPGLGAAEAATALDRVREAVESHGIGPLPPGALTISGGVAESLAGSMPFEALLHAADTALYQAKACGRNRVEIASPDAGAGPEPRSPRRRGADRMPEPVLVGAD